MQTSWKHPLIGAALGIVLPAVHVLAVLPPAGNAPVDPPPYGFAIDGDLMANAPELNVGDWITNTNLAPGTGGSVLTLAGLPINTSRTFHLRDPYNGSDNTFKGGMKWRDNPNLWQWMTGKPSSKTDINNALLHITSDTNGHVWVVVAADRYSTSGSSYIDFEFLQSVLTTNANFTFTSAGTNGGRTAGDLLFSLAFVDGGSTPDFLAYRWQTNGAGGFDYVDATAWLPTGRFFMSVNTNTISVPYGAFDQTSYAPNAFAEAAIDLSALLGNFDQCASFGFKTIMIKTKSSASDTATIEDFITPFQYTLRIGPDAQAGPDQVRCTEGVETVFPLQGTATSGLQSVSNTVWSVVTGTTTIDDPNSLSTTARVTSSTATLRLTVTQANGCMKSDDIVLTVQTPPSYVINGVTNTCPRTTNTFSAPAGMSSYLWSVTGNGSISGPANQSSVKVIAGSACGANYTVALTSTTNVCTTSSFVEVAVVDTGLPTLTTPADLVLNCPAVTTTNVTGMATATDGCSRVTVTYSDSATSGCGASRVIARTWTATDECGNFVSRVQNITVRDITAPVITCPAGRTLEYPANTSPASTGVATAVDTCGSAMVSFSDIVTTNCGNTIVIARTWTATDQCDNRSGCTQTITVRDTTAPMISCPSSVTLECPAITTTNATGVATATDAGGPVTITYADTVTANCGDTYTISRRWTATDSCNNSSSCMQMITVRDTTAPVINCPGNLTLEYPAVTTTNVTGVATANDTCSSVIITFSDSVTNGCGGTKTIARRWTATDPCGNSSSCTQIISVRDTTAPIITIPGNLTLDCPANTATNATGTATASDAGSIAITYADTITAGCGNSYAIARRWTATDSCGNASSGTQTITVRDITAPVITIPLNVTLDCPADTSTNNTGRATAVDSCGSAVVTFTDSVVNNCGNARTISRTWRATDQCGNSSTGVQTITVRDLTPPAITCPASRTLEYPASTSPASTGVATALDTCGSATVTFSDIVTTNCGNTVVIARTWTATDECNNRSSCTQTITVRDTTAPMISCPSSVTLECPAITTTNATGVATATDAGGAVTITYADTITANCGDTYTISRRWTATDLCNNSSSCMQTITVRDTTAPIINCPGNLTLEYPAVTTTNVTGVAMANDTCSSVIITFSDSVTNGCGGTKTIARRWTATDPCGNSSSCIQIISVRDTTVPVISVPANVTLDCPANTTTNATGTTTATDANGNSTINYVDSITASCDNSYVISRRWTVTDVCGNTTNRTQTITVRDITAPVITIPLNVTLDCPADTSTNNTGRATAVDSCGSAVVTFTDSVVNNCGNTKTISRTWRATDQCGNSSTGVQTITVRDLTPPVLTYPADRLVECGASTAPSVTGNATAIDACNAATVTYSDSVSNACGGTKVISRLWTATDTCGNSTNAVQKITVRDTTPPSLVLPANRVLDCPGDTRTNVTGVATAVDVCGSVSLTYSDLVVSNGCGATLTMQRRWTAVDQCGNSTNGVQTIIVQDKTPPTISLAPIKVQCVGDVPAAHTTVTAFRAAGGIVNDNCDADVTFSLVSDSGLVGSCPGTVTRVYRATDDCGNSANLTHIITVDDTIAPAITCASNVTVECGDSMDPAILGSVTATDNCDTNVNITYSDVPLQSTYDVSWYAADPAANSAPYLPTYLKLAPGSLPCPTGGRAADPLRNAVAFGPTPGQLDALTSLAGESMSLGQIMPFEAVIDVSGGPGPERGTIEFTTSWSTYTTSNDRFGFDKNYMVYCAFVDSADIGSIDPHANARVESFSSTIVNAGTIDEKIQGTYRVSGLDSGDRVIVEVWMVMMSTQPDHVGGTIASELVSAQKVLTNPQPISVGGKTISISAHKFDPLPAPQPQPPLGPQPPQPPVPPGVTVSVIDRTWAATDDCGNRSTCVQRITVRDATGPTLIVPADVVLEYPTAPTTNNTGVATALDCGPIAITYSDIVSNSCGNAEILWRVWTATDINGNSNSAMQTITVRDSIAPTITCPPNVAVEFGADTSPNALGTATASDFSGTITINFSDTVVTNCGSAVTITRVWTASDVCGNLATRTQTITVQDTTPPVLSGCTNKAIYAGNALVFDTPSAFDHCSTPIVSVISTTTNYPNPEVCAVTRTWTAMDACGNVASNQSQMITVLPPPLTKLEIIKLSDTSLLLRWPTYFTGYRLEWSYDLKNWSPVAITPILTNGQYRVYTTPTEPARYFRLVNTPPTLEIEKLRSGRVQLSWPTEPSGFALEASNNLSPDSWTPVAAPPQVSDAYNRVEVSSTGVRKFFRLKK